MPGLLDHRLAVEALDQQAALVVHREVHRADHVVAPVRAQPRAAAASSSGGRMSGASSSSRKPNMPQRWPWKRVELVVVLGRDPAHDAPVALGQEQLRVAVREERVLAAHQEDPALQPQRGDPDPGARVQPVRELDELPSVPSRRDGTHDHAHEGRPYMPTAIDVFAKVRGHERSEQLRAAREADLLPYFRRLEGPAGPVVEMEGAERIMLGSNNYLGLTADERVRAAARDALDRYGTGLTGSRLLNGTLDLHLQLEAELAEWMGTEEAIVFSTGHQANVGTPGHDPRPGRHGDRRLGRPRLDPRRLPALAGQAAAVPPQPAGQAGEDARARRRRRRRRARGGRRRLLDGGRRRAAAADRRADQGATARG